MKLDISERKRAELALAERDRQLSLAGKAALVGSFAFDVGTERIKISAGYAAIHGFPDGTTEIERSDWQAGVHPEDRVRVEELRSHAFRHRREEYSGNIVLFAQTARFAGSSRATSFRTADDGHPQRVVGVNIDATERKRAEEHQRTLIAELDHRVKNVLATVSAIITQTPKADGSLADFVTGLDDRIKSLARTHELLSHSHWHGVSLEEIVRRELAPYTAGNAAIGGPRVTLKADAAQAVAMVLHELATNAAKYGAFSKRDGRLLLRWRWLQNGSRVGWPSNGKSSAAPLFCLRANLAMGQALSANLFRSSWAVQWILILLPMDCAADWKSLLTGSAGPVRQASVPEVGRSPNRRSVSCGDDLVSPAHTELRASP